MFVIGVTCIVLALLLAHLDPGERDWNSPTLASIATVLTVMGSMLVCASVLTMLWRAMP